jgi:hypothetical protein
MRSHPRLRATMIGALMLLLLIGSAAPAVATPGTETVYANGQTVTMLTPHAISNPNPNLLASAPPFYVLAFPMQSGHPVLPTGYAPQCDPCLGVPVPPYHDHLLPSVPGLGTDGTAREYEGPWSLVVMMYNPAYVAGGAFVPVTSDEDLAAAEAAGEFLPIAGPTAPDPFELRVPVVLVCPVTSDHA